MEEKSIKEEQFFGEEEAVINEEKCFLAEPIKIEYQLNDYEYKSNTDFGSSSPNAKLSRADHKSVFPVKQEKIEDRDSNETLPSDNRLSLQTEYDGLCETPPIADGSISIGRESLQVFEPARSIQAQNQRLSAFPSDDARVICVVSEDNTFHPEFFIESDGEEDFVTNNPDCVVIADPSGSSLRSTFSEDTSSTSGSESFSLQSQTAYSRGPPSSSRKRVANLDQTKIHVAKAALNSGKAHITTRGKFKKARSILPPCKENCQRCKTRLSGEQRKRIFDEFWNIQNHELQWQFILRHMVVVPPKKKKSAVKNKLTTRKYFFRVGETDYTVCKTMFLNTLGVCDSWVDSIIRKILTCGFVEPDQRGRHNNRPKRTSSETVASISEHINLFERIPSHRRRKRSKSYLDRRLSVRAMFRMYLTWAKKTKKLDPAIIASERKYRKIFNTHYNLGFHQPRKDQCFECNSYKAASKEDKELFKPRMVRHILNKKYSKELMDLDKEEGFRSRDTLCVCSFDLQKVLPCPKSETPLFFYTSKMSLFNFAIKDMSCTVGYCYVWDEVTAKHGANEVASCLWDFISKRVAEGITEFRFYSDSCSGLYRNRFVFAMMKMAAEKLDIKITHTFLEPGHTRTEVDGIHTRIESATRHSEIFSKREWIMAIETANVTFEDYRVFSVTQDMIFDFKPLVEKQHWDFTKEKAKIKWGSVKKVEFESFAPNEVRFKYYYRGATHTANLKKNGCTLNLATCRLKTAYDSKIALGSKKVRDLQFLCEVGAIPSKYHAEYSGILGFPVGLARCATWSGVKDLDEIAIAEEETLCRATSDEREDDYLPEEGDDLKAYLAESEEDAVPTVDAVCGENFSMSDEELDLDEYFRKDNPCCNGVKNIGQIGDLPVHVDYYAEDYSMSECE